MEIKAITILLALKTMRTKLGKPEGNNIKAIKQDSFQFEIYQTLVKGRDIEYGCSKFFFSRRSGRIAEVRAVGSLYSP
jgi:hypothetical protein